MTRSKLGIPLAVVVALVGSLTLSAGTGIAQASFPGVNGKIAFTSNTNGANDLFQLDQTQSGYPTFQAFPSGTVNSSKQDQNAQWSPDGTELAFASRRKGDFEIYVWTAATNTTRRLTFNNIEDEGPGWSPDGSRIAFSRWSRKTDRDVYVMNAADGSNARNLTNHPARDYGRNWSLGNEILFVSNRDGDQEIYAVNADTGALRQLTQNSEADYGADWSPNGTEIIFSHESGTPTETAYGDGQIWKMNSTDLVPELLLDNGVVDKQATWSPDGMRICWASTTSATGTDYELYEKDLLTGTIRQLTNDTAFQFTPDYRPIFEPA